MQHPQHSESNTTQKSSEFLFKLKYSLQTTKSLLKCKIQYILVHSQGRITLTTNSRMLVSTPKRNPIAPNSHFSFLPPQVPGNTHLLCLHRFTRSSGSLIYVDYTLHDLSCLSPSMFPRFIPSQGWILFHYVDTAHLVLSIHQLVYIWVFSTSPLLWIMVLWTFLFLCGHMFLLFLSLYAYEWNCWVIW